MKQINEEQREGLLEELRVVNLSKFVSEAVTAVLDAKLKSSDINAAVQVPTSNSYVCCVMIGWDDIKVMQEALDSLEHVACEPSLTPRCECRSALYFTKDTKTSHQHYWQGCWKFSFLLKGTILTVIVARGQWRNVAHSGCWWSFTSVECLRMEVCFITSLRISQVASTWRTGKLLRPIFLFWLALQSKVGGFLAFL